MHPLSPAHNRLRRALTRITMFCVAEVVLTLLGLDDMADMGEWEERQRGVMGNSQIAQII